MASASAEFSQFHFTTARVPPAQRVVLWYEVFGRSVSRRLLKQTSGDTCHVDMTATFLARRGDVPGVGDGVCVQRMYLTGGLEAQRTRELLSDGNSDLVLHVQISGLRAVSQQGRHAVGKPGVGLLTSNADTSTFALPNPNRFISIGLPRHVMTALVPGVEDSIARPLPDRSGSLRLLARYLQIIADGETLTPELRRAAVTHIHDLCAVTIGTLRGAAEVTAGRGLRAARLAAIKDDVRRNLGDGNLSATTLALRQGITPRYVHKLFESEGTTLSRYVLGQRLTQIHRRLRDPGFARLPISTIAYDAGIGDLSTFNREFRRRFGATPSEVRAASIIASV